MTSDPTIESLSIVTRIRGLYDNITYWKGLTFDFFDF